MPVSSRHSAASTAVPPDFSPGDYPIIAQHWFGIHPANGTAHARDLRFQRDVQKLHKAGPRAVYEFLCEIGAARLCRTMIELRVADYGQLDPNALEVLNGDRMPPAPIHRVTP